MSSGVHDWIDFERAHNTGRPGEAWWCVSIGGATHSMKVPATQHEAGLGELLCLYCDSLDDDRRFMQQKLTRLLSLQFDPGEADTITGAMDEYRRHRHRSNRPRRTWLGLGNRQARAAWEKRERELRESLNHVMVVWNSEPTLREGPRIWVQFTDPNKNGARAGAREATRL